MKALRSIVVRRRIAYMSKLLIASAAHKLTLFSVIGKLSLVDAEQIEPLSVLFL
jgi:hypothetical protein